MPTWQEVQTYVRSKYKLAKDEANFFDMVWAYDDSRTQIIRVRHFTAFDKDWIEFRSPICAEANLNHRVALLKNSDFAVGAIALEQGKDSALYVMVYSVPLGTMDMDEFELPLSVIARTADGLEQTYAGGDQY